MAHPERRRVAQGKMRLEQGWSWVCSRARRQWWAPHSGCLPRCSPEWSGLPRPRAVLFGAGFGTAWGSAAHLHPLATPASPTFPSALGLAPFHVIWRSLPLPFPILHAGACRRWCWWDTAGSVSAGITCQGFATPCAFHRGLVLAEETPLLP